MSYQVLARRWRPRKFAEVVGQDHVTRTIRNALKQGRLAHAFLFTGPRGIGKTSTARILARAVNCPNIDLQGDAEPCNECETCRALFEDRELDVIEMDAASYRGVDDVRRINDTCRLAPVTGRKKIYIIDEVHMFTREAFNAFLKTLEEPPEHVIFILATTDVHKVPSTILSRVQRFDFRPVQPADAVPHLQHICAAENWPCEEEALWLIARRAEGSLRDAEGLLDQVVSFSGGKVEIETTRNVLGVLPSEVLYQATQLLAEHRDQEMPAFLEDLALRGVDYSDLLRTLQVYWTDLIFLKEELPVTGRSAQEAKQMLEAGAQLSIEDLFRLVRLAETLEDSLRWSTAPRIRFEVAFLRWARLDRVASLQDILQRLGSAPASSHTTAEPAPVPSATAPRAQQRPESRPPASAIESATATTANKSELSLENLRERWPEILAALRRRNPAAAAVASNCQPEKLDGTKLTILFPVTGDFAAEQMRRHLPALTEAVSEVAGAMLKIVPMFATAETAKAAAETPKSTQSGAENDLFASIANRFGGVEVDPSKVHEPE
jgi:DNA polymerase III subunit gamma/tau